MFFKRRDHSTKTYDETEKTPAIRCSICTGEQVACMRDRHSGKLQELMLIRSQADLESFCRRYAVDPAQIKKIY